MLTRGCAPQLAPLAAEARRNQPSCSASLRSSAPAAKKTILGGLNKHQTGAVGIVLSVHAALVSSPMAALALDAETAKSIDNVAAQIPFVFWLFPTFIYIAVRSTFQFIEILYA